MEYSPSSHSSGPLLLCCTALLHLPDYHCQKKVTIQQDCGTTCLLCKPCTSRGYLLPSEGCISPLHAAQADKLSRLKAQDSTVETHKSACLCWQVEQRQLREGAAAIAAELVSLRQHMAYLTSSAGVPNGMPAGRLSPNGMASAAHLPADSADLLSAATSGSLGITQVLVSFYTLSRF